MASKISKRWASASKFELGQNSDINVTPFVDVMLVLLIIFMVAAPLATVAIKIDIPPPDPNAPKPTKAPVLVNVQPGQKVYVGTQLVDDSTLISVLEKAMEDQDPSITVPTTQQVMIRADRLVPYKDFMDVLNVLQVAGFHRIALIAEDL